jgi:CHAT domain-containing protein/cytochrome c-type biogenesis protein CcmH/NrfG
MELIGHASECDACGVLLADLRAELPADAGPVDSPTEECRQTMAERLSKSAEFQRQRRPKSWFAIAASVVLAVLAGGAWWVYRTHSQAAVYAVIANTYSEDRPFEFRFSGAPYGPVRVTRGGPGKPASPELLEAEVRIARSLQSNPGDPSWLRAKGRVDLLGGNYSSAIDELRHARERDGQSPELSCDLAIAYLRRASIERNPADIVLAIDLLSSALKSDPGNGVYRFNRALAREDLPAPHEAADDWREFLRREPSGGWASEAREHLQRLEEMLRKQRGSSDDTGSDLLPGTVLGVIRHQPPEDVIRLARTMLAEHGDNWVSNLASDSQRKTVLPALNLALLADQSGARGEADVSRDLAERADHEFRRAGSSAGIVLAAYQLAYALDRSSQPAECEQVARQAIPAASRSHYLWLEAQLDLTLAACLTMEENIVDADSVTQEAERIAVRGRYPATRMQAIAWRAGRLGYVGAYREVLGLCHEALDEYWSGSYPLARAYECYFVMAAAARGLGRAATTATLSREAVETAVLRPNRAIEGMIRSIHAVDLTRAGDPAEASRDFALAERVLRSLKQTPTTSFYLAYATLGRAETAEILNRPAEGLKQIEPLGAIIETFPNQLVEIRYARVKGDLLAQSGNAAGAEESFRRVLSLYTGSGSSGKATDRNSTTVEASAALGELVELMIRQGREAEALRTWERYYPAFRSVGEAHPGAVRITFAGLPNGPAVWTDAAEKMVRLQISGADLKLMAADLRREVSDPHASVNSIRKSGADLFRILFSSVASSIQNARTLLISLDPSFEGLPFDVLVDPSGKWLAERYQISYSLPSIFGASAPHESEVNTRLRFLAVASPHPARLFGRDLLPLPDAETEARDAALSFNENTVLVNGAGERGLEEQLAAAEVFHFSGHAAVFSADAALVLSGGENPGVLWASQLSAHTLRNCRLAVLSACSTGQTVEDSDPAAAMVRAFLRAGVPRAIAARWDVDSRAAGIFMHGFYRQLRSGSSVEDSVSSAAATLRSDPQFAHPYYWAAFDLFRN